MSLFFSPLLYLLYPVNDFSRFNFIAILLIICFLGILFNILYIAHNADVSSRICVRHRQTTKGNNYEYLTSLPGAAERLKLFQAELLTVGSFDETIAGCEYVIHTASPYILDVKDPQHDLVDPALKGTLNVLQACNKSGSVKKIVLTSSVAAVFDEPISGHIYTEKDWNKTSSLMRNPYYYS